MDGTTNQLRIAAGSFKLFDFTSDKVDNAGFFNVEHSPKVKVIESERGTQYQAEGWPALRYLEQIAASAQGDHATRIADIVRAISSDAQQRCLDNWRTRWSLATILSKLPLDVMTDLDVHMVRTWLAGRFESNMVGQELGGKLLPRLLDRTDAQEVFLVQGLTAFERIDEHRLEEATISDDA